MRCTPGHTVTARLRMRLSRTACSIALLMWACLAPVWADAAPLLLRTDERRIEDVVSVFVESLVTADLTVTFRLDQAENVVPDRALPLTLVVMPGAPVEVFRLRLPRDGRYWRYHFLWDARLGDFRARHDDRVTYLLPYASGQTFRVLQGYHGSFSHKGDERYAIDWAMPEGTEVRAARAGEVVAIVDRYTEGRPDVSLRNRANYVVVRHADGTFGEYDHLQCGGIDVRIGQHVEAGDRIARSGNTGFTTEPHLHFIVYRPVNGNEGESFPVRFQVSGADSPLELREGEPYTAP